ncbi:hypothetical protein IF1G_00154 [Cordyceps javanica]|uniref:Uncharacterized protein n=1 Tax=Cordyceps javanica TaxID=43265 RepID=A0A545VES4_9HYPO|nr:hypothetical protein IF1G_00154 [Cordyceps javanica]
MKREALGLLVLARGLHAASPASCMQYYDVYGAFLSFPYHGREIPTQTVRLSCAVLLHCQPGEASAGSRSTPPLPKQTPTLYRSLPISLHT